MKVEFSDCSLVILCPMKMQVQLANYEPSSQPPRTIRSTVQLFISHLAYGILFWQLKLTMAVSVDRARTHSLTIRLLFFPSCAFSINSSTSALLFSSL